MDRALSLLAGVGFGAGLMYLFDPDRGRRRRALISDQAASFAHDVSETANIVAKDAANKAKGLASGDMSVLVGGRRALEHPFRGEWSPSARALMGTAGCGLFAYGLTRETPEACMLGGVGLLLLAEGAFNFGFDDVAKVPEKISELASEAANQIGSGMRRTLQHTF